MLLHGDCLQPEVGGDAGDGAGVVRLHTTDRHERVAALGERVGDEVLELAHLVAAEGDARVAVLALRPDLDLAAEVGATGAAAGGSATARTSAGGGGSHRATACGDGRAGASGSGSPHESATPECGATLKHMAEVGIRALKQNASAVVADAAAGETVTITDRGRPVAQMTPIPSSRLRGLIDAGRARPPRRPIADLHAPEPGPSLSDALADLRADER